MKVLISWEMPHDCGHAAWDSVVVVPASNGFTEEMLVSVWKLVRTTCAKDRRSSGLVPTGELILRSVIKWDG